MQEMPKANALLRAMSEITIEQILDEIAKCVVIDKRNTTGRIAYFQINQYKEPRKTELLVYYIDRKMHYRRLQNEEAQSRYNKGDK